MLSASFSAFPTPSGFNRSSSRHPGAASSFAAFQPPEAQQHAGNLKFGFEPISTGAAVLGGAGHVLALFGGIASGILATLKGCFCFCGCALPLLLGTALLATTALSRGKSKVA